MNTRFSFALALALPFVACMDSSNEDEFAADDATEGDASKADAPGGTYTYYFLEQDLRACLSPHCGGVAYRLANATKTKCFNGSFADRCYAASADFTKLGLGDEAMQKVMSSFGQGGLLVRATVGSRNWGVDGSFAHLNLTEAWLPQGPKTPAGPLAKVEDNGVRCFTHPCPSLTERKLNSAVRFDIAELDWDQSEAASELIGNALDRMHTDGLIISGYRYTATGPGGEMKARTVTQFWLRATDAPAKQCVVSGCSGQLCADQPLFSTCEWLPEYACYDTATCEVQSNGNCGWTQSSELLSCLSSQGGN